MCKSCFELQVTSQCDPTSNGDFIDNGSKIVCGYCKEQFNDREVISNIDDATYEKFKKAQEDSITSKAYKECEEQFIKTQKQSKIAAHKTYICENILTLHCEKCNAAVLDFDGCFAITCAECKGSMCGWCMKDFSPDAHDHVKKCPHSLCPGSFHGSFEQFTAVHKKNRLVLTAKYLDSIFDAEERNEVIKIIKKELDDLGIDLEKYDKMHSPEPNVIARREEDRDMNEDGAEAGVANNELIEILVLMQQMQQATHTRERERERERENKPYDINNIINNIINYNINDNIINYNVINKY